MRFNFPVSLPVCVPMQRWCCERFLQMHGHTPAVPVQWPHVVTFPSPARPHVTPLLRKMSPGRAGRREEAGEALLNEISDVSVPVEAC